MSPYSQNKNNPPYQSLKGNTGKGGERAPDAEPQLLHELDSSPRTSRVRRALGAAFVLLLVLGVYAGYWELSGKFRTVDKGNLYRSAELPSAKLAELCRKHRIRTVIDLRTDEKQALIEESALKMIGVEHIHLPSTQIPSPQTVKRFLRIMDDPSHRPVLLHCVHGIGRTGIFTAIYRIEYQDWSNKRALLEAMFLSGFGSFLPTSKKAKFIIDYTPSR